MSFQVFTDQMGRSVTAPVSPRRIISLVPSQTELLFDLGLEQQLVGITKFCIHPAGKVKAIAKIGGTKKLDLEKIRALQPDLIIGNKEENERSQVEALMQEFSVWMSDISDLAQALDMISAVGHLTGREPEASYLHSLISAGMHDLQQYVRTQYPARRRVAYLIWKKPYMLAGRGTFIDDMLMRLGMVNAIETERYPELSAGQLAETQPDHIFLSSEPYPFGEKHIEEFRAVCPGARVSIVDGEMFSWYGSRLRHAPGYMIGLADGLFGH